MTKGYSVFEIASNEMSRKLMMQFRSHEQFASHYNSYYSLITTFIIPHYCQIICQLDDLL